MDWSGQHQGVEWLLLFVLWSPVLGAILLRASVRDATRRARAFRLQMRATLWVHVVALFGFALSVDTALMLLAMLDLALLATVAAVHRDEVQLESILTAIRDPACAAEGIRQAESWLRQLHDARRAPALRVDHGLACAEAMAEAGFIQQAEALIGSLPATGIDSQDAGRTYLSLALLTLDHGHAHSARRWVAQALGQAPLGTPEQVIARAIWALLDSVEGKPRRALASISRIPLTGCREAMAAIGLARAHVLAARGENEAARVILRALAPKVRGIADRWARVLPGPASPLLHTLERHVHCPYR